MKKANILTTGFLSAVMLFAANDKSHAQSNAIAFNNYSTATTKTYKAPLKAPLVEAGGSTDAYLASTDGRIAIRVYGGTQDKRSAQENAKILANAFADREYTDKPMYLTAVYDETEKDKPTTVAIFMDGVRYSINGVSTFTPRQVGGAIDIIAEDFVDEHGDHLVIPEGVEPVMVASLN